MPDHTYTEAEIKAAFWAVFHKSGELWFQDTGSKEERDCNTTWYWNEMRDKMGLGETWDGEPL